MNKHLGERKLPTLSGYLYYSISFEFMKELTNTLTTLLVIFLSLKLIDFSDLGLLDYIIIILVIVLLLASILTFFKKRGGKH